MPPAISATITMIIGFILLAWSAKHFVCGAVAIAEKWGVHPVFIGLTVVSVGTSAPEFLVSLMSTLQGHSGLAVGNAIGSNIANMGLALGLTALISPLPIKKVVAKREIPWMVVVTVIVGTCLVNDYLGPMDSFVMLSTLFVTLYLGTLWQKTHPEEEITDTVTLSAHIAYIKLIGGLVLLSISARLLVWGAENIAIFLGISDLVIGLTVVAIGTSLPEIAASITSAIRGHHDIAIGNVVGSNIFNMLTVLPIPGFVAPEQLTHSVFSRDYVVMLAFTIFISAIALIGKQPKQIGRFSGVILLTGYACYGTWLYVQAV